MTVRVGVLGAGRHSTAHHGPALQHLHHRSPERITLAAVCDLDAGKADEYARRFGFARSYTDTARMLNTEHLDALVTVTPPEVTGPVIANLLPRRLPLLIEKPPGLTVAGTAHLLDLATRHETGTMVSFNRRFNPAVRRARAWIGDDPQARRPHLIVARMLRIDRREPRFITETGIHLIDTVLSFLGVPRTLHCSSASDGAVHSAHATFAEDAAAVIAIAPRSGTNAETLDVCGPGFDLRIDIDTMALTVHQSGAEVLHWQEPDSAHRRFSDAIAETDAFLSAVEGRRPYAPDLATGLESMRVAEAIQECSPTPCR